MHPARTIARLGAVGLVLMASLPGPLELVHDHAGSDHPHVHANAVVLALHALFHHHAHAHHHHRAQPHGHDHPAFRAGSGHHVHALDPFQLASRTALAIVTIRTALVLAYAVASSTPRARPWYAARPRGPPARLVG